MYYLYVNCDCIGEYESLEEAKEEADKELGLDEDAVIDVLDEFDTSVYGFN